MKVEIYSDVVCPWCYIGEKRFQKALAAFEGREEVEVVFRPYQLDPSTPSRPEPLREALQRKFGARTPAMIQQVGRAAAAEGIDLNWDDAISNDTFTAHRLLRMALAERGPVAQRALAEGMFDAHFTRGMDIGDHGTLASLAVDAGLDEARVTSFLASDEGEEETRRELDDARALGISAVPTFVFEGKYGVPGAQESDLFLQVLQQVAQELTAR